MARDWGPCLDLQELQQLVDANGIKRIDLRVTDLLGRWQHFTIPPQGLSEDLFQNGHGFDGSSLRGFQEIHESDMLLVPDIETAVIDPIPAQPTVALICDVIDTITRDKYSRDPRNIAAKAEEYMRSTGIADTAYFGPELEFFMFDDVRYQQGQQSAFYFVDSSEAHWNAGTDEGPNLGYKVPGKEGYAPLPPFDATADLRAEIVSSFHAVGIDTFVDHHEVATAGQAEIGIGKETLLNQADRAQWYKYLVRNVTRQHGKVATFMPKPIFDDNASGMHTHQSLWKNGESLFYDPNGYAGLSQLARWYIGGMLRHAATLLAFGAPTTNSYKRLVPGFEAPVNLVYSMRNRSAAIRISTYRIGMPDEAADKRIEFRPAGPERELLPRVRGDAHGRPRRHPESDRPGRPRGPQHLRSSPRGGGRAADGTRLARGRPRRARGRPGLPAAGRRLHAGRDRHVARLQARRGCSAGSAAHAL